MPARSICLCGLKRRRGRLAVSDSLRVVENAAQIRQGQAGGVERPGDIALRTLRSVEHPDQVSYVVKSRRAEAPVKLGPCDECSHLAINVRARLRRCRESYLRWLLKQVYRKQGVSGQVALVRRVPCRRRLPLAVLRLADPPYGR